MPVVTITIVRGRSIDQKRALAASVTQSVVTELDVQPDYVTI